MTAAAGLIGTPTSCRSRSRRTILGIKREHPSWGAPKIRDKLIRSVADDQAAGRQHDPRRARSARPRQSAVNADATRPRAPSSALRMHPTDLWCADFKGEFMLGNKQYCYPLTITDYRSRYLLACEGLSSTRSQFAFTVFERAFKDFGLPDAIRTDNGAPFASGQALFGLCQLSPSGGCDSGSSIQRIKPGHPQQNGRHERMHLTLKKEATKPASFNFLQQQERSSTDFIEVLQLAFILPHLAMSLINIRVPCSSFFYTAGLMGALTGAHPCQTSFAAFSDCNSARLKIHGPSGNG